MPLTAGHNLQLLHGGAEFFPSLVAAIDGAEQEVWLETYIFYFDASGERVAAALERAALRGVVVYLVVDGIGTPVVPVEWVQRFGQAGVRWHQFSPLGRWGLLVPVVWRRMHRKLCVVDREVAFAVVSTFWTTTLTLATVRWSLPVLILRYASPGRWWRWRTRPWRCSGAAFKSRDSLNT